MRLRLCFVGFYGRSELGNGQINDAVLTYLMYQGYSFGRNTGEALKEIMVLLYCLSQRIK